LHIPTTEKDREIEVSNAIDLLKEICFHATFPTETCEIEKGAVLSELNSANTPEFRSEFQKFQQIHCKNMLSKRFPIGKEEQVLFSFLYISYHPRSNPSQETILFVSTNPGINPTT
jgi:hypothetical protein